MAMLEEMMEWVKEVPIQPQSNQRFGNLAFRSYIKLVEEVSLIAPVYVHDAEAGNSDFLI
jgi:hypothetical protein